MIIRGLFYAQTTFTFARSFLAQPWRDAASLIECYGDQVSSGRSSNRRRSVDSAQNAENWEQTEPSPAGGWPIFALHYSHGGCPILAFCKGGRRCRRRNFCPFYTTRCGCRRRTRPFDFAQGRLFAKYTKDGAPALWWHLQSESRSTPAKNANEWRKNCVRRWKCPTQARGRLEWATRRNDEEKGQYP